MTLPNVKNVNHSLKVIGLTVMNTVMPRYAKLAKDEIAKQVLLPNGYITRPDRLTFSKASIANLVTVVKARKRGTTLTTYGAKAEGKRGQRITVAIKRGGMRKLVAGGKAFFVPLRNTSIKGVFVRRSNSRKIKHLYGPSVSQLLMPIKDKLAARLAQEVRAVAAVKVSALYPQSKTVIQGKRK